MAIPILKTGCDATPLARVPQQPNSAAPKLLDRLRLALETRRYRPETVGRFVEWNRQFVIYGDNYLEGRGSPRSLRPLRLRLKRRGRRERRGNNREVIVPSIP